MLNIIHLQYFVVYWTHSDEPPYLCLVVAAGPPPHWCQPPWCGVVVASSLGSGWSRLNRHLLPMWHALVSEALHLYSPKIQRHWVNFAWINSFGNFMIIYNGSWGKFHTHLFPSKVYIIFKGTSIYLHLCHSKYCNIPSLVLWYRLYLDTDLNNLLKGKTNIFFLTYVILSAERYSTKSYEALNQNC